MRAFLILLLSVSLLPAQGIFMLAGSGEAGPSYTAFAARFDGSDYLREGSAMTGLGNTKVLTVSYWIKWYATTGNERVFSIGTTTASARLRVMRSSTTRVPVITGWNSSATQILGISSSIGDPLEEWTHILWAIDMDSEANCKLFINGVEDTDRNASTFTVGGTLNTAPSSPRFTVGGNESTTPGNLINASLSEFWLDDVYLADPTKFIAGGKPVDLGADGSTPTGSQPAIYLREDGNSFGVNHGTGPDINDDTTTLTSDTPP